jgi:hypothetical protein
LQFRDEGFACLVRSILRRLPSMTPMARGINCFLAVWEHACHLDCQNAWSKYLEAMLADILSCDYASEYPSQQDEMVRAAAE